MNKIGSLESQLMESFKEKEEKEIVATAADAKKIEEKELATFMAEMNMRHRQKFNNNWRKKNKKKRNTAKASRKANRK